MLRKTVAVASFSIMILGLAHIGLAYEILDVPNGGTIAGRIAFTGTPPAPRVFDVNKEPEVCGKVRGLTKVEARDGLLQGAVVVLEGIGQGKPFEAETLMAKAPGQGTFTYGAGKALNLKVTLENCNFGPFTGVVSADQLVTFENQDSIKHTLHTYVLKGRKANILRTLNTQALAPHSEIHQEFPSPKLKHGRVVVITCDRHDFMENWMYVVESPYFAISDERGKFSIDEVPPGQYHLVAWHPVLGIQRQEVRVGDSEPLTVNFEFSQ